MLGVALAGALLAETFVAAGSAVAAPPAAPPAEQAPAAGPLEAPDIATARTIARLQGERVEVIGERTETSSTFALPDGTMSTGQAPAPIWMRTGTGDGTAAADWAAVDPTLELGDDGDVRPKGHPADLVLAGEGVPEDGLLLSMTGEEGQSVGLEWSKPLPKPRLEGPRAVYPNVQPGVDLVVEATRTGYEQFFVLTKKPGRGKAPDLSLRLRAEGLQATAGPDGSVEFHDAAGTVRGSSSTPQAWDAAVDGERLHPIGKPWERAAGEDTAMSPQPEWGGPAEQKTPPGKPTQTASAAGRAMPTTPATAPLPEQAGTPAPQSEEARPGRAGSADAVTAKASPLLPLTAAATISAPGAVDVQLTPDDAFLQDSATKYPVVIDPEYSWTGWFDTWVQHGFGTDQSASGELRLGTFDGGYSVARSFINLDLSGLRYKNILSAGISLYEWHAWSCSARNWQVWNTDPAGSGTRIGAQPAWWWHWSTSSQTMGGTACSDGWVGADITGLVQAWSDGGAGYVGMGLKAEDERDNFGWKKFNSADAGWGMPSLWVRWNSPPGAATGLMVVGGVSDNGVWTNDGTPSLAATAHDADGYVHMHFQLYQAGGALLWQEHAYNVADGQAATVHVPPGVVSGGKTYIFLVDSYDSVQMNMTDRPWSPTFTVDVDAPPAPTVTSTAYPSDGTWHGAENQAGAFTLALPKADPTISGYMWALDKQPDTKVASADGSATLTVTPTTNGKHELQVQSIDKAGNRSPVVSYRFFVGRAGLTSPIDGAQVVRRVRLSVAGESVFTHVKFVWRRGPDAETTQDISLSDLSRANGRSVGSAWIPLSDVGDYVTWDAGSTLGQVGGPVQVQALMATSSSGAGAYPTTWTTVTVSPDAKNAAADSVGPGSVNLLTGDYRLGSTDVDEFGLSIERTASSRQPRAGLEEQAELVAGGQSSVTALDGWAGQAARITRVTGRGHTGLDSVQVDPTGGSDSDSYAHIPALQPLRPGGTYRASAWVYVPEATGLTPNWPARGLRIAGLYPDQNGTYQLVASSQPTKTNTWQQLSLDFTVPANAQAGGRIRLYSGFSTPGKVVYFDDLSIREVWAPFGPQWSLGTADAAAGTAYTRVSQPAPDVATVHTSDGGEIWFTASGDGRWWSEPGAESLTLTKTAESSWRLTELDGTVSDFAGTPVGGMEPGRILRAGEQITSANGVYRLAMQTDGNLVIYGPRGYTWATMTSGANNSLHMQGDGNLVEYNAAGVALWHTYSWGNPGARMTLGIDGNMKVVRQDGTTLWQSGTVSADPIIYNDAQLVSTSPPAASGQTRLVYENVNGRLRLSRMIAAVEPGVDGAPANTTACTGAVPAAGCEVMQLVYSTSTTATATTFGSYAERLSEVRLWSAPTAGATQTDSVVAVKYAYDDQGRLREVWDPRISPALKTSYEYDADGRIMQLAPPGELPWKFRYGTGGSKSTVGAGDLVDRSSGRLLSVSRASLVPGTTDQPGPDTTSTVVYAVPLTRAAGGPYDLDADTMGTWAQRFGPTDATAIFGPEDVPSVTTASDTVPGRDGYRPATIHYLDASGREVNTATPSGPDAPAAGFIDTAEYDQYGNVVRSLDATNRLLALGQLPSAAADLAALNLAQADSAARAVALSSLSTYGPEGLDLLRSRGPLVRLAVGNDPNNIQLVHDLSTYVYDEGKPDGVAYHLVTTQADALLVAGSSPEQLVDVEVTKNGYDPIDGADKLGPSSGWKIGSPTKVTFDATGANLSALVRYDAQGKAVESRGIGSTGSDSSTNLAVYYTAGANSVKAECGNKPAFAGLPCMSYAAGAVTGHDASRMAGTLPMKHVTGYNRYGSIASVTESATGPVNGTAATVSRTTVTEYDAADRVLSVTLTASGAGAGAPVVKTVNRYDETTGDVTVIDGVDPAGAVVSSVRKSFDLLGRMTRYEDGNGGWTTSVFDKFGKPTTVTDSTGATTSFTYDRAKEPRGFVTSVQDSVGGTVSASYGPDGQVTEQTLPGGVALRIGYDANRTPIDRTYVRTSDDAVIAASAALENSAGQMVTHATPAASKRYTYDALGRLTDVQDSIAGTNLCAARKYGYSVRGNRTSLATAVSGSGACVDPAAAGSVPVTSTAYTYDTADRLVTESTVDAGSWVYDPLGRITTAPVRGSPGAKVVNAYFANDLIASQTIDGVARQSWTLDAIGRFAGYTNQAWAVGGDGVAGWQEAVTKVNHYDSDSDSPAWIAEDASLPDEITRYVDGLDGNLALETGKTGGRVLQLIDLHGDVMTTLPIRDGESTADWTALKHQTADEFGNPTDLTTGAAVVTNGQAPGKDGRYGWLGGKQRSADALAGVLLMGVRLYDPATGRFWSRDPSPGGNSTAYDYCSGDPVNCTDLDGHWGFFKNLVKKYAKKVAKIAEAVATVVPGPIGAAAAAISAGAYAASGNKAKALEMGVTAVAAMIPGGGAMVKAGFAAAKAGGRVAAKIGKTVAKPFKKGCNSFTPETGVLMADGTTQPISEIDVGDLVAARDPLTGEVTAQPVLNVIVSYGDKHLISVTTSRAPPNEGAVESSEDTWLATANHPIWVEGTGWTDAVALEVGDVTTGASGQRRAITSVVDHGRIAGRTVYNLSVANTHTFVVGAADAGVTVHNSSGAVCTIADNRRAGKAWEAKVGAALNRIPGVVVRSQTYFKTDYGRRFLDFTVETRKGRVLFGVEAKWGSSRHTASQRLKDTWIQRNKGFPIFVVRGGRKG